VTGPQEDILLAATPGEWFALAQRRWADLLLDHANCEKKAASTALSLMFAYAEDFELAARMSRLAREELRHFELVQVKLKESGVPYRRLSPSRYAEGLRRSLRRDEPARRLDLLLCGALIEARSCERFVGLVPLLEEPLASFYSSLARSEARHIGLYLRLAEKVDRDWAARMPALAEAEAELVTAPDSQFRFHSGRPV
jgi:tRNA-(ms[2]io[6]A)-hydroxylase